MNERQGVGTTSTPERRSMKEDRNNNRGRAGFSMVEVLVASTILVVIVMMLAMLFQQTGLAWRTGVQRADAFVQLRSLVGALQRDASAAIDEREIPAELRTKLGGGSQQFSDGEDLKFYTLTGTGFPEKGNTPYRTLTYVTYDTSGRRTERKLKADGTAEPATPYNVMTTAIRSYDPSKPSIGVDPFDSEYVSGMDSAGLPLYVRVHLSVIPSGYTLDIGAASAGPDKTWGTKDDIRTW